MMNIFESSIQTSITQPLTSPFLSEYHITLNIRREDLLHPEVSGNKFRKLKYNLLEARSQEYTQLLTFGGAFSNHIAATAAAGNLLGFKTVGIIRGEELGNNLQKTLAENTTLRFAVEQGMQLYFINREKYREKENPDFLKLLKENFGKFYNIPEGGTNELAIKGCKEILEKGDKQYDIICTCVGTGGTMSGLIEASSQNTLILGFSALKGDFLNKEIAYWTTKTNWKINSEYHFGGYAKIKKELIEFMNTFYQQFNILLDPIYTAKMMYGIFDLVKRGKIKKNTRILAIHTGGLQGITGMNMKLKQKGLPLINT